MKGVTIAAIIVAIVIVIYIIEVYYVYVNKLAMFAPYQVQTGSEYAIYNPDPVPLDDDEIQVQKTAAANNCQFMANMKNFVSLYCDSAPASSGIDCSGI